MTARQVFEATLIELSKVQAPALKLYEFNYLFNKAINLYINKVYNVYDLNQQTTDDLRVLKSTAYLTPKKWNDSNSALHNSTSQASSYLSRAHRSIQSLHGATYEVAMPIDYLHLLNCVCIYYVAKQKDCWDAGSYIEIPATRLTADSWSQIVTDIYNRPSPMKPYYYIHNLNNQNNNELLPTDPIMGLSQTGLPNGTDMTGTYNVVSNGVPVTFLGGVSSSTDSEALKAYLAVLDDKPSTTIIPAGTTLTVTSPNSTKDILYTWTADAGADFVNDKGEVILPATSAKTVRIKTTGGAVKVTCKHADENVGDTVNEYDDYVFEMKGYATEEARKAAEEAYQARYKTAFEALKSSGVSNAYINVQGKWHAVYGLTLENGVVRAVGATSLILTEIPAAAKGLPEGDTAILDELLYNKSGKNVTAMYYPDPSLTLGWAQEGGLATNNYKTILDLAESNLKDAASCANVTKYRKYLDEYLVARALFDNAKSGYTLVNTSLLDGSCETGVSSGELGLSSSNFPRTFKFDMNGDGVADTNVSLVEKPTALRAGNISNVRMEIRYGKDDSLFLLKEVQVDYVKSPQFIRLTQEQIDLTEDTSQIMEFPDYVNQEIINELVHLVMERVNDPRLSNNMSITNTIARLAGAQQQPALALAQLRG